MDSSLCLDARALMAGEPLTSAHALEIRRD
jgi:hypothetical protein